MDDIWSSLPQKFAAIGLGERLYSPHHAEYKESLESYWSQQEAQVRPRYIVKPQGTGGVSKAVKLLSDLNIAHDFSVKFAVRSGGNQPWPGCANIEGGVTIDLRALKHVEFDENAGTVIIGTGCAWDDVYEVLDPQGLTVTGSRFANGGVAGACISGGISYFTPKNGMICDNVIDFEVVLANGEVVHANKKSNDDLFKALKGGSNNHGIVVAFTLPTFPSSQVWGGTIVTDMSSMSHYLESFHELSKNESSDENASIYVVAAHHYQYGEHAFASLKYMKPVNEPEIFKRFSDGDVLRSTMRLGSLRDMVNEESAFHSQGKRRMFMTTSFRNDLSVLKAAVDIWSRLLPKVKETTSPIFPITFNTVSPAAIRQGLKRGGNVLGLNGLDCTLILVSVNATWNDEKDDTTIVGTSRELLRQIDEESRKRGVYHPYKYLSNSWEDQNVIEGYGEENVAFLQTVSKAYDPHQIFQKAVPGGFKLY